MCGCDMSPKAQMVLCLGAGDVSSTTSCDVPSSILLTGMARPPGTTTPRPHCHACPSQVCHTPRRRPQHFPNQESDLLILAEP